VDLKIPVFPSGAFQIRSVMTGKSLGKFSGEQLQRGISVPLPTEHKVEVLEVRTK
jgi:hypothetical protein